MKEQSSALAMAEQPAYLLGSAKAAKFEQEFWEKCV